MATDVNSYFFKLENFKLTIEDIRKEGYIAKETRTGFLEVNPFFEKLSIDAKINNTELTDITDKEHKEKFLLFFISNMKENAPKLMHYTDDPYFFEQKLSVYHDVNIIEKHRVSSYEDKSIYNILKDVYGLEDFYTEIDFTRDTEKDLRTEEQIQELKDKISKHEEEEYNKWKAEFNNLSQKEQLLYVYKKENNNEHLKRFLGLDYYDPSLYL